MKPQSMGATVATLEQMSLVERRPHPTDGRQFQIALTETGQAYRYEAQARRVTWLAQAVGHLSEEERRALFRATEIIKRLGEM
jgi:DNA-binding MarR family transcriptional regulator